MISLKRYQPQSSHLPSMSHFAFSINVFMKFNQSFNVLAFTNPVQMRIGIIKSMNKTVARISPQPQKPSSFTGLMQLKLIESSHKGFGSVKQEQLNRKLMGSNINTPSTIADFKKFHSCELVKRSKGRDSPLKQGQEWQQSHRRCESSTKILTLREIKLKEGKSKQKQTEQPTQAIGKSSSRKLFVSIARHNSRSKQKRQPVCEINNLDGNLVAQEAPKRQKIKIKVYKDIARKNALNIT